MSDAYNKIEFLSVMQAVHASADQSRALLNELIAVTNPPEVVLNALTRVLVTVEIQDELIRKLVESMMQTEDQIDEIVAKLDNFQK